MKLFISAFLFTFSLIISEVAFCNNSLPAHNGKCGDLQDNNMGEKMEPCAVGDVVIVQRKVVPMYCDYRYSIHHYANSGPTETFSCVLRVTRKNRNQ